MEKMFISFEFFILNKKKKFIFKEKESKIQQKVT